MDDAELVNLVGAAARGDAAAWARLVSSFSDLVWFVARGRCDDRADAADVCQTTWLRLVEALPNIKEPARLRAWLITTTRREARRLLKARLSSRSLEDGDEELFVDQISPEQVVIGEEPAAGLWEAFEELPSHCRDLMRALMADSPPSYRELSRALHIPIGSIGPMRARCLDRLRTALTSEGLRSSPDYQAGEAALEAGRAS